MAESRIKAPPKTLKDRGKRLWRSILTEYKERGYVPEASDYELLERGCELADVADRLREEIDNSPLIAESRANGPVLNRAVEGHRQSVAQLQRILKQLSLPDDEDESEYDAQARSRRGVHAANVRWMK